MTRPEELAAAIARCQDRQKHAERTLGRFVATKAEGSAADRQHRKLIASSVQRGRQQEHPILCRLARGDSSQSYFIGCRNQH
jgi:hypothetical protein